jgi:hypothetical protein
VAADNNDYVVRIWCGPDDPPRGEKSQYTRKLNSIPPNVNVYLKAWNISERLAQNLSAVSLDLLEIAAYIYSADQSVSRGGSTFPKDGRNWYRQFELSIPVRHPEIWNREQVSEKLTELLSFMSNDDYRFVFRPLVGDFPRDSYFEFDEGKPWFEPDSILLFSGGLDSLTGVVEELQDINRSVLLVSHRPVSKIDKPQRDLVDALKNRFDAPGRLLHIPVWVNKEKGITRDANQRSRSFLYASLAAVIASMTDSREIKLYENGIVSCNLPISNQVVGARASRSTHPKTLRLMSELYSAIFENEFKVMNPFFGKTKSDVLRTLKVHNGQELIPISRSCTRTMRSTRLHTHCGTCSQCIERRLAILQNELDDFDPEEMYQTRLFLDPLGTKDERMMVENYMGHARLLEEIGIDDFFERFPDGFSMARGIDLPIAKAGQLLYDLHNRHGRQTAEVVNSQISKHSDDIRKGRIPPNSLLGMIVGKPDSRKPAKGPLKYFPTPSGTHWKDIQIDMVSRDSLVVRVGSITKRFHSFDMGFRDHRRVDMLNKQWDLLETLAMNRGTLNWEAEGFKRPTQKRIEELNKLLRYFFGLPDNPIAPYKKGVGWVAKFQIFDKTSGKS